MVQEARELASRIRQESPGYKRGADLLEDLARSLGKQGLLPSNLPDAVQETQHRPFGNETSTAAEINLDAEWQRQAHLYLGLGYYAELGMTDKEYLESLPKFEPQPEEYRDRFSVPLLIETRIPWEKQAQLAGITVSEYLKSRLNETKPHNADSETPNKPYTGWFSAWGERFIEKIAPEDAQKQLVADEIGGGPHEGVAMQVAHAETLKEGKYFDLIGYKVESDGVPYLGHWRRGPKLDAAWGDSADGRFRPLVRGSKIVTK